MIDRFVPILGLSASFSSFPSTTLNLSHKPVSHCFILSPYPRVRSHWQTWKAGNVDFTRRTSFKQWPCDIYQRKWTLKTRKHSSRMRSACFCGSRGGGGFSPRGRYDPGGTTPMYRMTDACENITFPQLRWRAVIMSNGAPCDSRHKCHNFFSFRFVFIQCESCLAWIRFVFRSPSPTHPLRLPKKASFPSTFSFSTRNKSIAAPKGRFNIPTEALEVRGPTNWSSKKQ